MANAIALSYFAYHRFAETSSAKARLLLLVVTALIFFLANTLPVSVIISLTEGKSARQSLVGMLLLVVPLLPGRSRGGLLGGFVNRHVGWQTSLLVLPLIYWVYRSYRLYLAKLEAEKRQVEIEKTPRRGRCRTCTCARLKRWRWPSRPRTTPRTSICSACAYYAIEIAKELGFRPKRIEALRAAALLHDIGKLAVPEHIINKPGRLTPEEFEKMKIHPIVGAEILERVAFPYPVAPIVRSHHERWDGSGYPDGLKGEQIPRGARVLAAVDCLDALASHRQYRAALPLDTAMNEVAGMSGSAFDPEVVEILKRRYRELETMAQLLPKIRLSPDFQCRCASTKA